MNIRPARVPTWLCILVPIMVYGFLRFPAVVHMPGGQDEHWFSVPGLTVWEEGIPRIPYVPTRNRTTFFENADRCLMALPPGLFYCQAPFFAIFPAGYATARGPLFVGALAAIAMLFFMARKLGASTMVAGFIALIFAMSRPLMFTGQTARPDLLCVFSGWLCILGLWNFLESRKIYWLGISGAACGLGALFHPFAMVFAMQAGIAMCFAKSSMIDKVKHLACFATATASVVAFWLPLIILFPYEFRSQFFSNVLERAGPGLPSRLIWPWPSLRHHAHVVFEFAGTWQCILFGVGLLVGIIALYRTSIWPRAHWFSALCFSSIFLTAVVAGVHPIKGYWLYPCFWTLVATAYGLQKAWDVTASWNWKPAWLARSCTGILMIAMLLPGGGLKTTLIYLRHWGDARYHAPTFIAGVLEELPREGLFLADLSYVFDVYLSGRQTMLCQDRALFWGSQELDYEAILLAWEGADANWPPQYHAKFERRAGSRDLEQSCFVDIFRQKDSKHE